MATCTRTLLLLVALGTSSGNCQNPISDGTDPSLAFSRWNRDWRRARALAEIANDLTHHDRPELLDTLGAAYAAGGDFARAVSIAERTLELAIRDGMEDYVDEFRSRLALYRTGRAYVRGS